MSPVPDAVCAVCGAEHDPEESPEVDSTHLCPTCAANERALRDPRGATQCLLALAPRAPDLSRTDAPNAET